MKYCSKCLFPETCETIEFDEEGGVSNASGSISKAIY